MTNASNEWEAAYERHRFDDEAHETEPRERPVHARADIDAHTFPCGVDAQANVEVGSDADVTCDACNAELQRRAFHKRRAAELKLALAEQARTMKSAADYEERQARSYYRGSDLVENHGKGYGHGGGK